MVLAVKKYFFLARSLLSKRVRRPLRGGGHAILGAVILALAGLLAWTVSAYSGARAEAELLDQQGRDKDREIAALVVERRAAVAATDSALARADSVIAVSAVAVADAQATTDLAVAESETAFRNAVALAADDPVLERAIEEMRAEQIVETMAWEAERAEHVAAAAALTQQLRTVQATVTRERAAWTVEANGLREALALSRQESDAWERAAKPGALKQLWQQGRAAALVAAIIVAIK